MLKVRAPVTATRYSTQGIINQLFDALTYMNLGAGCTGYLVQRSAYLTYLSLQGDMHLVSHLYFMRKNTCSSTGVLRSIRVAIGRKVSFTLFVPNVRDSSSTQHVDNASIEFKSAQPCDVKGCIYKLTMKYIVIIKSTDATG